MLVNSVPCLNSIEIVYSGFMNVTAFLSLKLVPESLHSQPIFLCIDDTIVAKFGKSLIMYQNFLTMPLTMAPVSSKAIVLSDVCSVSLSGGNSGLFTLQSLWDTACEIKRYPNSDLQHP